MMSSQESSPSSHRHRASHLLSILDAAAEMYSHLLVLAVLTPLRNLARETATIGPEQTVTSLVVAVGCCCLLGQARGLEVLICLAISLLLFPHTFRSYCGHLNHCTSSSSVDPEPESGWELVGNEATESSSSTMDDLDDGVLVEVRDGVIKPQVGGLDHVSSSWEEMNHPDGLQEQQAVRTNVSRVRIEKTLLASIRAGILLLSCTAAASSRVCILLVLIVSVAWVTSARNGPTTPRSEATDNDTHTKTRLRVHNGDDRDEILALSFLLMCLGLLRLTIRWPILLVCGLLVLALPFCYRTIQCFCRLYYSSAPSIDD